MPQKQSKELQNLADNNVEPFIARANKIIAAQVGDSQTKLDAAIRDLAGLFEETMTLADLIGRATLLRQAESAMKRSGIRSSDADHGGRLYFKVDADISPVTPGVRFEEAIDDIVSRSPILQQEMESGVPRYLEIQKMYRERHAFGLAKSFSDTLTKRVHEIIKKSFDEGTPIWDARGAIQEAGNFTHAYAETVYRTNLNTAYTAGTFQEMKDPVVQLVFGGLEFVAVLDPATRDNHSAAHGLIASTSDKIWDRLSPPLGYNCRCSVFPVDFFRLKERGLLKPSGEVQRLPPPGFSKAAADSSAFGRRPDANVYG